MIRVAYCIGEYPEVERQRRADVALSYASEEVEVGILAIGASPYHGLGPAEIQGVHPIVHKVYVQAEKEGYDAVVPLGMLDLGVDGGRSLVDIPVIGPAHACLHVAALVGERFGLICYQPTAIPRHRAQIRAYGMENWIAGYRTVSMAIRDMTDNRDEMTETFVAKARELIDDEGADVIIPHGISQCPVHIKPDWLSRELGVPVVEGIGAPIRVAAMLAGLGLSQSRVRWPKSSLPEGA
ncbi:MAG: aspartate/glutamate racemase family protein [Alphaproteobacteria bacterium]